MAEIPKTREELWRALVNDCGLVAEEVLDAIEALGLRIVPEMPTEAMLHEIHHSLSIARTKWAAAIAANPFAPEKSNG